MHEVFSLLPPFTGGLLLGVLFFGGLWWTVRKGVVSTRPALWFFSSYVLRLSLAAVGFAVLADGDWSKLAAGFLGFVIVRLYVARFGKRMKPVTQPREVGHAIKPR